ALIAVAHLLDNIHKLPLRVEMRKRVELVKVLCVNDDELDVLLKSFILATTGCSGCYLRYHANRVNVVSFPKDFVKQEPDIRELDVADGNADYPVVIEQCPRSLESRVHHSKPIGMEPTVRF